MTSDADYDTYGQPQAITDDPTAAITRFGYAGEYTDPTGYLYLRARYYDPNTAQFLTRDPLETTTGNPYGYTDGNPLQNTDPLGLDWWNPLSWSGDTYDNIALGATGVALGSALLATGSAATVIGVPAAAAFGTVALVAEGVTVVASLGGVIQHARAGDGAAALASATGLIPGVGMAARWVYETKYAVQIATAGKRVVGRTWRQVAQGVEAGTLWGGGLGVWLQNYFDWNGMGLSQAGLGTASCVR